MSWILPSEMLDVLRAAAPPRRSTDRRAPSERVLRHVAAHESRDPGDEQAHGMHPTRSDEPPVTAADCSPPPARPALRHRVTTDAERRLGHGARPLGGALSWAGARTRCRDAG